MALFRKKTKDGYTTTYFNKVDVFSLQQYARYGWEMVDEKKDTEQVKKEIESIKQNRDVSHLPAEAISENQKLLKKEMIDLLKENGVDFSPTMKKNELMKLIKENKLL